jgi:hypothetical protein
MYKMMDEVVQRYAQLRAVVRKKGCRLRETVEGGPMFMGGEQGDDCTGAVEGVEDRD